MENEKVEVTETKNKKRSYNENLIVTMSVQELDNLIYWTSYRSSRRMQNELFKGLVPFFNLIQDQQEEIIREQENIRLMLQDRNMDEYEDEQEDEK